MPDCDAEVSVGVDLRAPVWARLTATLFVLVLVPYYWATIGWRNFLWLSDMSLFTTVVALWIDSPLLISMLGLGVLPFELYWNLTFFVRLLTGAVIGEIPDYMFDATLPLLLRIISLFHVALPIVWIRLLARWGYDRRALRLQWVALIGVVLATYALTPSELNINWVYAPAKLHLAWLPESVFLIAYMVLLPLLLYWPLHRLYVILFPGRA